jgi:hypothetical protein
MTTLTAPEIATDRMAAVLQVFQTAGHPLTLSQAQKLYTGPKLGRNEMARIVEEQMVGAGQLFKCSPAGKQARYWAYDEEQKIRTTVEGLLAGEALAESKLVTAVNKALSKVSSPPIIKATVERMRRERQVHEVPGKNASKVLSLRRLDPLSLIRPGTLKDLSATLMKAASFGVALDEFLQSLREHLRAVDPTPETMPEFPREALAEPRTDPSAPATIPPAVMEEGGRPDDHLQGRGHPATISAPAMELEELILKGMRDLETAEQPGARVPLRDLRRNMPAEYRQRDTFDSAVIRLFKQGRVDLNRHDEPELLTEAERDELVRDPSGTYFASIANRL